MADNEFRMVEINTESKPWLGKLGIVPRYRKFMISNFGVIQHEFREFIDKTGYVTVNEQLNLSKKERLS